MTKKDYIAIAAALASEQPFANEVSRDHYGNWERIVLALVQVLSADNPRFDRSRFLRACGLELA